MLSFEPVEPEVLGLSWSHTLYLAGRVPPSPRVAVVGSRAAHRRFVACVPAVLNAIAVGGATLVSGGAVGIDAAAHRAALDAGVPQLAVLPCPPESLYPADHRPLFEDIVASGGSIICAQPPGSSFSKGMFASRNALVVQLSSAVIGIEAAARSGTRGTLALALRRNVSVGGIVGTAGVAWAVERGAVALGPPEPATLAPVVLAFLRGQRTHRRWPVELARIERALKQRTSVTADDFEDPLAAATALIEAEAEGLVAEVSPGRYVGTG